MSYGVEFSAFMKNTASALSQSFGVPMNIVHCPQCHRMTAVLINDLCPPCDGERQRRRQNTRDWVMAILVFALLVTLSIAVVVW